MVLLEFMDLLYSLEMLKKRATKS